MKMDKEMKIKVIDLNKKLLGFLNNVVEKFDYNEIKIIIAKIELNEDDLEKVVGIESILNSKYEQLKMYFKFADEKTKNIFGQEIRDLVQLIGDFQSLKQNIDNVNEYKNRLYDINFFLQKLEAEIPDVNKIIKKSA